MNEKNNNGWGKWENHVLAELNRYGKSIETWAKSNSEAHDKIREMITRNYGEIQALKVKAGVWGLFGGTIPAMITLLAFLLYKFFG